MFMRNSVVGFYRVKLNRQPWDANSFQSESMIISCEGPGRLLARALGIQFRAVNDFGLVEEMRGQYSIRRFLLSKIQRLHWQ